MARSHSSPVRVPHWPDSADVLESEQARIEYHLLEGYAKSGDSDSMASFNELANDVPQTSSEDTFPYQVREGAEEGDKGRFNTMRRRYSRQVDDVEAEDDYVYSPTSASRLSQIEPAPRHVPRRMLSRPSRFPTSNDMMDQHLEYRRKLVLELKFGQFRLSLLSNPTAPDSRIGTGFLWLMLAIIAVGIVLRFAVSGWRS